MKFGDVDIALHLDNANIAHLIIRGIELVPQTLDFSLNVDLVPVDVHGVGDVAKISNAVSRLAVGALDVMAGINGALIKNENNDTLPWLDTILSGLKVRLGCGIL